jgi:DNA-directed RNA polymerase specialized sigma24 family protein
MADGSPLGYGEIPSPASRLVIVLLPLASEQPANGIPGDAPVIVTLPRPGIPSGAGQATVADPEFATYYQAEMPELIGFLIKCGAEPDDAPEAAQDAFRELFDQWKTVGEPKPWLRKAAFPIFLRRPVRNASSPEESNDAPASPGASSRFDFGDEDRLFIALTRLLPTAQRAVLALHIERFQTLDIAEILGMKPDTVRKNLKEARATLMKSLNLNDNTWTCPEPPAAEPPTEGGQRCAAGTERGSSACHWPVRRIVTRLGSPLRGRFGA